MKESIHCIDCGAVRLVEATKNNPAKYQEEHPRCNPCSKVGFSNSGTFNKGQKAWNKGVKRWWSSGGEIKKGEHRSKDTEFKKGQVSWSAGKTLPERSGDNHPSWKGDKVSYSALHHWVKRHRGKAAKCEHCDTQVAKRYEWANKSRKYLRDLDDWLELCGSCHAKYDNRGFK